MFSPPGDARDLRFAACASRSASFAPTAARSLRPRTGGRTAGGESPAVCSSATAGWRCFCAAPVSRPFARA